MLHTGRGARIDERCGIAGLEDVLQPAREEHQAAQELGGTRRRDLLSPVLTPTCPSTPFAIDRYTEFDGSNTWLLRAGIRAPKTIEPERCSAAAARRWRAARRHRHPGRTYPPAPASPHRAGEQYEKLGEQRGLQARGRGLACASGSTFTDYLDTGLFSITA
jgi:hypothetical protein